MISVSKQSFGNEHELQLLLNRNLFNVLKIISEHQSDRCYLLSNKIRRVAAKSIDEIEEEITEEFSLFNDWMEKYEYIIELGKGLPLIDEKFKIEEYKVKGCQSQVWLNAELHNGKMVYRADSDAVITKGLIALLIRVLSNQKPEDITETKLEFLDKIGMKEHLSPNRANGLTAMINYMKKYASNFITNNVN